MLAMGWLIAGAGGAEARSASCPSAIYQVRDAGGTPAVTTITVGETIALDDVCGRTPPRSRAGGTTVVARWASCAGVDGAVQLRARLTDDCRTLRGKLRGSGFTRELTADRIDCGDGVADALSPTTPWTNTRASLATHQVPRWFDDAKFGIMIHWGIFAIPAWAETVLEPGEWLQDLTKLLDPVLGYEWFKHIPYTEWYANTIQIDGTPAQAHHRATYGENFPYENFRPQFDAAAASWSASTWADAFRAAGARYVVLVTKHHDGYALWPTAVTHPIRQDWHTTRDYVGELSSAVRARCMRMGLYYSGNLDWSVNPGPIRFASDTATVMPQTPEYQAYADGQWRELIARYHPAVLWNDLSFPDAVDELQLFADYYNTVPDGLVNDRFTILPALTHFDYRTAEYFVPSEVSQTKFEEVRGMGRGFGWNRTETDADYLPADALIRLLVDVVSKNGNLLLNVGPRADGSIPDEQMARLTAIGNWLSTNGESIFASTPTTPAFGTTTDGAEVRYTQSRDGLTRYAFVFGGVQGASVSLRGLTLDPKSVRLLGTRGRLRATQTNADLQIKLPKRLPSTPVAVFALTTRQ